MKSFSIACVFAALVFAPLALAKLAVPNDAFGSIEASLDFCAQVDPQSASKYQEQKKLLVQGASDQEVAEARASKEYKDAYDAVTEEMGKQPKEKAKKTCAAALEGKN